MTNRNLYLVSILLFRGAFPYPVVIKILTYLQNTEGVSRLAIW